MPEFVSSSVTDALNERGKPVKGSRILVSGSPTRRASATCGSRPSLEIIETLLRKGAQVQYADPFVPTLVVQGRRMMAVELKPEHLRWTDAALILTDHREFDYRAILAEAPLVVDTRNATRQYRGADSKVVLL